MSSDLGSLVERKSAPEAAADALRERIITGDLEPGAKIAVEKVAKAMGVSANTLREALQLLEHERLVTQRLNRGIFVREVTRKDIPDLFTMRRLLEIGTLRQIDDPPPTGLAAMRRAVDDGHRALADKDWSSSTLATVSFHSALVSMLGCERASETMQRLMAEMRLTLALLHEHLELRSTFQENRRRLVELLEEGSVKDAIALLERYLDDGEKLMLAMTPN